MKAEDLKGKTEDELKKLLLDARKEQFNQRFQKAQGSLEKTDQVRVVRRNIARMKTLLTQGASGSKVKPVTKTKTSKAAPTKAKKSSKKAV